MAKLSTSLPERLAARIARAGPDDCWLWTGCFDTKGYGSIRFNGKLYSTHRLALAFAKGDAPPAPNNHALHADNCVSRACCNPRHLRWGSNKENTADRNRLGKTQRGTRHWCAKLTDDDVRALRASSAPAKELAEALGISPITVGQIRSRHLWKHVA